MLRIFHIPLGRRLWGVTLFIRIMLSLWVVHFLGFKTTSMILAISMFSTRFYLISLDTYIPRNLFYSITLILNLLIRAGGS